MQRPQIPVVPFNTLGFPSPMLMTFTFDPVRTLSPSLLYLRRRRQSDRHLVGRRLPRDLPALQPDPQPVLASGERWRRRTLTSGDTLQFPDSTTPDGKLLAFTQWTGANSICQPRVSSDTYKIGGTLVTRSKNCSSSTKRPSQKTRVFTAGQDPRPGGRAE
jgi:hypothetical protein